MASIQESDENICHISKVTLEEDHKNPVENGLNESKHLLTSPKKINRSISETVQHNNCDSANEMPHNMNIRLQTSGQHGMPNEVDCVCEAVGKDSSSVQYSCEYQISTGSPIPDSRTRSRRVGMDMTDEAHVDVNEDHDVVGCVQRTKRMTVENLPASRIHGKFSLNIPYVSKYIL